MRIPQTIIKSQKQLNSFFENYDIERRICLSDKKLQYYGGENGENPKEYFLYHLSSDSASSKISMYTLDIWMEYEQGKFLAKLCSHDKSLKSWKGEVSRYESCLSLILKQSAVYNENRYAFLQLTIPDKATKKIDFMEGTLTGLQHTGRQLLLFRILVLKKKSNQVEDNLAKVTKYFDLFKDEPNNMVRVTPTLNSEFLDFFK